MRFQTMLILTTALTFGGTATAQPVFDEDGPFRMGEGFGTPATCQTIGDWIDRVPDYDGRISMVIEGPIRESHWDGALAYLIMCDPAEVQVMCITYYEQPVSDQPVMFAGGYVRAGEAQIVLDPCLTYPAQGDTEAGQP